MACTSGTVSTGGHPAERPTRLVPGNLRGTPVGEQLKAPDFVHDAGLRDGAKLFAEMMGDDQRARGGIEPAFGVEHTNMAATRSHLRRCEKPCGGAAHHDHTAALRVRLKTLLVFVHSTGSFHRKALQPFRALYERSDFPLAGPDGALDPGDSRLRVETEV